MAVTVAVAASIVVVCLFAYVLLFAEMTQIEFCLAWKMTKHHTNG